jgi:hypothetical protein
VDLHNIGVPAGADVKDKDLKKQYEMSNRFAGEIQDRCLFVCFFHEAVCCAKNNTHDPKKLTWWNGKDKNQP